MSISAIVPTRGRPEMAREAVASIRNQTVPVEEIVIADDGDGATGAVLAKEFGAGVIHTDGAGPAGARNAAIALATGEWLAFCDDDDTWMPERIESELAAVGPETVLVFADALRSDGRRELTGRGARGGRCFAALALDNWIPTSTVLLRREAWERCGGFAPRFSPAEDFHLWLRVARMGVFSFVDRPLATYRVHAGQLQTGAARMAAATAEVVADALARYGDELDVAATRRRLRQLRFVEGLHHAKAGDDAAARQAFARAWAAQPTYLKAPLFWMASLLRSH